MGVNQLRSFVGASLIYRYWIDGTKDLAWPGALSCPLRLRSSNGVRDISFFGNSGHSVGAAGILGHSFGAASAAPL